ncbi:MAG: hypothetical protein ABSC18_15960 [Verrucomicrobiota bacterium]|jgi:hypothetical protein
MGILTRQGNGQSGLRRLPSGAFTVDAQGNLVSSTVPQWVPEALVVQIGRQILAVFKGAAAVRLPFSELRVHYEAFRITAREMRGGAIIFLSPKPAAPPSS